MEFADLVSVLRRVRGASPPSTRSVLVHKVRTALGSHNTNKKKTTGGVFCDGDYDDDNYRIVKKKRKRKERKEKLPVLHNTSIILSGLQCDKLLAYLFLVGSREQFLHHGNT